MTDLEELPEPVGAECEDLRLLLKVSCQGLA